MKKSILSALSAILVFVMVLSFAITGYSSSDVNTNNWMSAVDDTKVLTEINIPGTHDTATKYVSLSLFSKTQSLSISEQLESGVRYFDTRIEYDDNDFYSVHGIANCKKEGGLFTDRLTAGDIVEDCKSFLNDNPTETILFQLKEEQSSAGSDFYTYFYDNYIEDNLENWYLENRIPTLGEVRGKIVLLRVAGYDTQLFDDSNSGINFGGYPYIGDLTQYNYQRRDIEKADGTKYSSMYVQDSYKLEGDDKWECIKTFLDSDINSDEFNICMTNCTRLKVPKHNARNINKRIMEYDFQKGKYYGIISVDYVTEELCRLVINTNSDIDSDFLNDNTDSLVQSSNNSESRTKNIIVISICIVLVLGIVIYFIIKRKRD